MVGYHGFVGKFLMSCYTSCRVLCDVTITGGTIDRVDCSGSVGFLRGRSCETNVYIDKFQKEHFTFPDYQYSYGCSFNLKFYTWQRFGMLIIICPVLIIYLQFSKINLIRFQFWMLMIIITTIIDKVNYHVLISCRSLFAY